MKLQTKIALSLGPFVLLVLTALFVFNYTLLYRIFTKNAQRDLQVTEQNMYRSVQALLSTAISNNLRGITESNLQFVQQRHAEYLQGKLSEQQAKAIIQQHFNEQVVGKSGYMVAVQRQQNRLFLELHPFLKGEDCTDTHGCRQWEKVGNGYTEYDWQNPKDNSQRKKAAYVVEFRPWNWIIGASSYRDEFVALVKLKDLEQLIGPIRINQSGYFAVFDENGRLLVHPELLADQHQQGLQEQAYQIFNELKTSSDGYSTYMWKNPSDPAPRHKYAFIERLEDFNWYLVATGYLSEVHQPIQSLRNITIVLISLAGLVLFLLIFRLSRFLTRPLMTLERGIQAFDENKAIFAWQSHDVHEINILGNAFARMTQQLTRTIDELQASNRQLALSEQQTRENRALLESTIDAMPSQIIGVDKQLRISQWNNAAARLTGRSRAEADHRLLCEVYPEMAPHTETIAGSMADNRIITLPSSFRDESGKPLFTEITIYPLLSRGLTEAVLRIDDITERLEMEQQLRQSQKMDAIGHLAGGMAHDFNNMLGGILGAADALRQRVAPADVPLVNNIRTAAERAGELTRNLLAFARKEHVALAPVDLTRVLNDSIEILKRTLDKKIVIESEIEPGAMLVMGERSQLQSSLLNMGINAGHAMPDGGTLSFVVRRDYLDLAYCQKSPFALHPGPHILLTIRDSGSGIAPEHLKQIFDPFFTTKEQEKGTGLGLAAVYGTVQQHHGEILVDSSPGRGTVFTLRLPLMANGQIEEQSEAFQFFTGQGNILIIDDEPVIRLAARFMLEGLGYTVHEAENGLEGIDYYRRHHQEIDLVLLDMIMPVMDGDECFQQLKVCNPDIRVVLASGFTREADFGSTSWEGLAGFIRKPYTLEELSALLHRIFQCGEIDRQG
jgi:PAS domain S-box-containing protein